MKVGQNIRCSNRTKSPTPPVDKVQESAARSGRTSESTSSGLLSEVRKVFEKQFPGVQIQISNLENEQDLSEYAKNQNGAFQIVFSEAAAQRILSDADFREQCQKLIADMKKTLFDKAVSLKLSGRRVLSSGIYLDEDGNDAQWIVSRRDPQAEQQTYHPWLPTTSKSKDGSISRFQGKDGREYVIKRKQSYRPAKDLARLARARNQQMVKTTISSIRGSIYQLKSSSGDKKVAKQLINQAEQVLLKAQLKSKQLKREELLECAGKRAEKQSEFKKAMYLKRLLEHKREKRMVREYTQIRDYYPSPAELKRAEERAEQLTESTSGPTATVDNSGLQSYAPGQVSQGSPVSSSSGGGVFVDISM